jgi:hypothetical protein
MTSADLENINNHLSPQRIPKEFPKNCQRISKEFPKISQRFPKEFPKNSQRIPKEFPKNSQRTPKEYPTNSQNNQLTLKFENVSANKSDPVIFLCGLKKSGILQYK